MLVMEAIRDEWNSIKKKVVIYFMQEKYDLTEIFSFVYNTLLELAIFLAILNVGHS